jgi:hypothetical protein
VKYEPAATVTALTPGLAVPVNVIVAPPTPEPVEVSVNVPVSIGLILIEIVVGEIFSVKTVGEVGRCVDCTTPPPCEIVFDEEAVHESDIGEDPLAVSHACP